MKVSEPAETVTELRLGDGETGYLHFDSTHYFDTVIPSGNYVNYFYYFWLDASGSVTVSAGSDTFMLDFKDVRLPETTVYDSICSSSPNLDFTVVGSCKSNEFCVTTVNLKSYSYVSSSDFGCSPALPILRTDYNEAFGISNCQMMGSCIAFEACANPTNCARWGQSTAITRASDESGLQLFFNLHGNIGGVYQMCFSSSMPDWNVGDSVYIANMSTQCDLGCYPHVDCTFNSLPGNIAGSVQFADNAIPDSLFSTAIILQSAGGPTGEHQAAYAWGHMPSDASSFVPGFAFLAAVVAFMM